MSIYDAPDADPSMPITCHEGSFPTPSAPARWRPAETGEKDQDGYHREWCWRTCWYCGSMHPGDLLDFLRAGAKLESADWKYGWPHKFYVNLIQNPWAGRVTQVGSRSGPGGSEPIMGKSPATLTGKFYSAHLRDVTPELLKMISDFTNAQTRIEFERDEKGLRYVRYGRRTPQESDPTPPPPAAP